MRYSLQELNDHVYIGLRKFLQERKMYLFGCTCRLCVVRVLSTKELEDEKDLRTRTRMTTKEMRKRSKQSTICCWKQRMRLVIPSSSMHRLTGTPAEEDGVI